MANLRIRNDVLGLGVLLLVAPLFAGCESGEGHAAQGKPALAGPEESFNRIMERIKRKLDYGTQRTYTSGGLDPATDELNQFFVEEEISHEVFKPEREGESYTAEVVITRKLDFFHSRTSTTETSPDETEDADSSLAVLDEIPGEPPLDGDIPPPPGVELPADGDDAEPAPSDDEDSRGSRRSDHHDETDSQRFKFAYENGKWVLKSEVEEESMELIFNYALDGQ